jgi:hypothetical protein
MAKSKKGAAAPFFYCSEDYMFKSLLVGVLVFFSGVVFAEDDCPSAVDAAEAQNHNVYKNCDYSKSGLNGILHRTLAGKAESGDDVKDDSAKTDAEKKQKTLDKSSALTNGEFNSPQQLQSLKFALLEKIASECTKGFVVEGERYLPAINSKVMKLELIYHCL